MRGLSDAGACLSFIGLVVDAVGEWSWACEAGVVVTGTFDARVPRVETSVMQNKILKRWNIENTISDTSLLQVWPKCTDKDWHDKVYYLLLLSAP